MPESKQFETQKQRWMKYGANVVLTVIVVIVLAGLLVYLAQQKFDRRIDTTATGVYSLKPQTVNIIQNLSQPIKIVSLYSAEGRINDPADKADRAERMQTVQDLLEEYQRKGKNITVDFIDPKASPAKEDRLIKDVTEQYGGEVTKYRQFLEGYEAQRLALKKLTDAEAQKISTLNTSEVKDENEAETLETAIGTVQNFGDILNQQKDTVDRLTHQKPPDYKGAVDQIRDTISALSQLADTTISGLGDIEKDPKAPADFKTYATQSIPRYQEIKKQADAIVKQIDTLGDLKLDQLRQSLKEEDSILVMGPSDLRVIPRDKVWKVQDIAQVKQYVKEGTKIKPTFAGEQQISTAIVSLTRTTKPKVAFIRPGGPPLTDPGMPPFQQGGPLSDIADRLREYNFDVVEKDLSGQYAMQAQMQGQPAPPEPSDAELKDAIWVLIDFPMQQQQQEQMPSNMGPKLAEHLKQGGAAMVMLFPNSDPLTEATKPFGIEGNTAAVCVHEPIKTESEDADPYTEARKIQYIFDIRNYGDHEITRSLHSLESLFVPILPVKVSAAPDCTVTPLVPLPTNMQTWGATDIQSLEKREEVKYDPAKGDLPPPLYGGAASEKKNGARLVVYGLGIFPSNELMEQKDPELLRRGIFVSRFPANGELFMNTMYWLSKQETMIAISPNAMEVSRIADMSDTTLNAWRVGLLLIGLPGLVILSGIGMYFARRD